MRRLAVDFGARFADLCLTSPDDQGGQTLHKQPLTDDPAKAMLAGLQALGIAPAQLDEVRIATTRPLNRLLARDPAPIALICTAGHGDVLELARQDRVDLYAPVAQSAAPLFLAPRAATFEIAGRIGPDGAEAEPLDHAALDGIIAALRDSGTRAVAVSLLFAHSNPAHERAVAERLTRDLPDIALSLSHRVDPAPREYERTVATLVDAWMRCTALPELDAIDGALRAAGFAGQLCTGDGRGVVRSRKDALDDPTAILGSGPAAAARGALAVAGAAEAVVLDIGSSSTDLMLVQGGAPAMADPGQIGGIPLRRDLVDMVSIALGGTSRVSVHQGRLQIGAAEAPVLDDLLTAAGSLPGKATTGPDPETLAAVAARLAEEAIRFATRHNVDPLQAGLVVCGGTGGLLAADIAHACGLSRVTLPQAPAATGATGLAMAPDRREATQTVNAALAGLAVAALLSGLSARLGVAPDRYRLTIAPRPEMHPMTLMLQDAPTDAVDLEKAWRDAYADRYEIAPPGPGHLVQISAIRDSVPVHSADGASATAPVDGPRLIQTPAGGIWVPDGWRLHAREQGYVMEVAR